MARPEDIYLVGAYHEFVRYCRLHNLRTHWDWVHWVTKPDELEGLKDVRILFLRGSGFLTGISKLALMARKVGRVPESIRRIPE